MSHKKCYIKPQQWTSLSPWLEVVADHLGVARALLEAGCRVNAKDVAGRGLHSSTSQHNLSRSGQSAVCVRSVTSYDPWILLHATETTQRVSGTVLTLSRELDECMSLVTGHTPLHHATNSQCTERSLEVAGLLIAHGSAVYVDIIGRNSVPRASRARLVSSLVDTSCNVVLPSNPC